MSAYYNEIDPNAAEWLRQLIKMGQIAPGDVDERSIEDVTPDELKPYTQCHFFAGIAGWSYALRLAGWPDDRPVWTGSAPCQPFSTAGKGAGFDDERHLWPAFFWLIQQCQPATVFGEQVASKDGLGWWDVVSADLEAANYACGAFDLCAPGVGAFHIRQRLYWVANTNLPRLEASSTKRREQRRQRTTSSPTPCGAVSPLAAPGSQRRQQDTRSTSSHETADGRTGRYRGESNPDHQPSGKGKNDSAVDHTSNERLQSLRTGVLQPSHDSPQRDTAERASANPWDNPIWLPCADGKARPTQRGIQPLVNGLPRGVGYSGDPCPQTAQNTAEGRVMRLKGYGNAIVPQLAAEFVGACMESFAP